MTLGGGELGVGSSGWGGGMFWGMLRGEGDDGKEDLGWMIQFVPELRQINPMPITSTKSCGEAVGGKGPFVPRVGLACPCCCLGSLWGPLGIPQGSLRAQLQLFQSHTLHLSFREGPLASGPFLFKQCDLESPPTPLVEVGEGAGATVQPG